MQPTTNDRVLIEGLTVFTTIGIYEWEKTIKQKLVIDIEMAWSNQQAGLTDNIHFCLDYFEISKLVTDFIECHQFGLIERVGEEVSKLIFQHVRIEWLKIKISKPDAVANAKNVAIVIERTRMNS